MMPRFQPVHVFHLVCMFIVVSGGLLTPGPACGQTYDWLAAEGPEGGSVDCLAQAPNGDIYAGLWNIGGVFRSVDQGLTWQVTGLPNSQVHSLAINNAGVVFAGASTGDVFRSTDHGATWPVVWPGLVGHFGALAYDPDLDILYAAKRGSFFSSNDGGLTWGSVGANFPDSQVQALVVVPSLGILYAGTTEDKVFRSGNGGVTWDLFDAGMSGNGVHDLLVVPEGYVYAATFGGGICSAQWDDPSWTELLVGLGDKFCSAIGRDSAGSLWAGTYSAGAYVSHNGGLSWAAAQSGMGESRIMDFLFPGASDYLAASGGGGVFRTVNSGATWTPSSSGMNRTVVNSLLTTGTGAVYAAVHGGGVHRSLDDGVTWEAVNSGIEDLLVKDVVDHPDGELFCGTLGTHIHISNNGGDNWWPTGTTPAISGVACLAVKPSTGDLFAGGVYDGGVWRSVDKGVSWVPANGGLPIDGFEQLIAEDDGDLLAVTANSGIFRSENNGDSWAPINNGLPALYVDQVLSLPGGILFAAISGHGLFRSVDDGGSWEPVDSSLDEVFIRTVAANPNGFVFAGGDFGGRIFQSSDGGDSWVEISGPLPRAYTYDMAFTDSGQLLVGTSGFGVIYTAQTTPVFLRDFTAVRSSAGSVSVQWFLPAEASILNVDIFRSVSGAPRELLSSEILIGYSEFEDNGAPQTACDYWLRVTDSSGTQSWYGPVSVDKAGPAMARLAIESVWPNPAPGSTTVRFTVPMNQTAGLDVYDLRGRLVRRLRQTASGPGSLETVWDARDDSGVRVPSGTYFLRLSTENKVVTGKMVVLGRGR